MSEHSLHHGDEHTHGGTGTYMSVFGCLVVLTIISFWLGNSSIKETSPAVCWAGMMAVSSAKAMLVIMFFMHLKWEANWKYVLTIPAMMMSVFLVLMLIPDVGRRMNKYSEERLLYAAEPEVHADEHGHMGDGHGDESSHDH